MTWPFYSFHSNIEEDDVDDDENLRGLVAGRNSGRSTVASTAQLSTIKSPEKGGKKVHWHVTCSLVPDVVLQLKQSCYQ